MGTKVTFENLVIQSIPMSKKDKKAWRILAKEHHHVFELFDKELMPIYNHIMLMENTNFLFESKGLSNNKDVIALKEGWADWLIGAIGVTGGAEAIAGQLGKVAATLSKWFGTDPDNPILKFLIHLGGVAKSNVGWLSSLWPVMTDVFKLNQKTVGIAYLIIFLILSLSKIDSSTRTKLLKMVGVNVKDAVKDERQDQKQIEPGNQQAAATAEARKKVLKKANAYLIEHRKIGLSTVMEHLHSRYDRREAFEKFEEILSLLLKKLK